MTLFQNKFRIEPARLKCWNYASGGLYFITICTKGFKYSLGKVENENVILSPAGLVVKEELLKSFEIRKELECISYVIMPNHLHLIVKSNNGIQKAPFSNDRKCLSPRSISSFIAGFKSSCTFRINSLSGSWYTRQWHPRFHDHIIRNYVEYLLIASYICNNPRTWEKDCYHQNNSDNPNRSTKFESL